MPKAVKVALSGRGLREECGIRRIGAGIAALDIIDADLVEHAHDHELVVEREVDARRLLAVAQGRVEEIEPLAGHHRNPMKRRTK